MPLLAVLLIFFLGACHAAPTPTTTPAKITGQWSGQHGGTDGATNLVVRDRTAWAALWRQVGHDEPLTFDPATHMAVAVFLGERRTAGFGVNLIAVREDAADLVVEYREKTPAPDQRVAQMLTSPWAIAVLPASERTVVFRKSSEDP